MDNNSSTLSHADLHDQPATLSISESQAASAAPVLAPADLKKKEKRARKLNQALWNHASKSLEVAIQLGEILVELKNRYRQESSERNWETYVKEELHIEPRSASNYMRMFRNRHEILAAKTETVSEMGVSGALKFLANSKKHSSANGGQELEALPPESPEGHAGVTKPMLDLADGSKVCWEKIKWKDGLISKSTIENWISKSKADPAEKKSAARHQRAVICVAAEINRQSGAADHDDAKIVMQQTLQTMLEILESQENA